MRVRKDGAQLREEKSVQGDLQKRVRGEGVGIKAPAAPIHMKSHVIDTFDCSFWMERNNSHPPSPVSFLVIRR